MRMKPRKLKSADQIDFDKGRGLVPAIVQDAHTRHVLMLGYMNREALEKTLAEGRVTFFSRSRNGLWTKGETSGHWLEVKDVLHDCDADAVLVMAVPHGSTCHTGTDTCFGESRHGDVHFLEVLEGVVQRRKAEARPEQSYTARLLEQGLPRIAQKVGEEAVETVIAALHGPDDEFVGEAADLLYHLLVLLAAKGHSLADVVEVLEGRHG